MEASELRVGLYFNPINRSGNIHMPVKDIIYQIKYFEIDKAIVCKPNENIVSIANPIKLRFSDLSHIPLTEEWLIKFGFETIDVKLFSKKILRDLFLLVAPDVKIIKLSCYNDNLNYSNDIYIECKYVHQLQNLYFALTGEELKINL